MQVKKNKDFVLLIALFAVTTAATSSCGKGGAIAKTGAQPHQIDARSEAEAKAKAQSGEVSCKASNPADCSPAVGMMLYTTTDAHTMMCSAFLVSSDIAITNSHCIPDDLKPAGSKCSDRAWFYFPELNGLSRVRVGCAQVLMATSLKTVTEAEPDYAVVRLAKPVQRPALEISREGLKDGGAYKLIKIDPKNGSDPVGFITSVPCKAVHGSGVVANSYRDNSANMAIADCEVVHGNSGSPLLDKQGHVHGVIQMRFEEDKIIAAVTRLKMPLLEDQIAHLGAGTSFACMEFPPEVPVAPLNPGQCSVTATQSQNELQAQMMAGKIGMVLQNALNQSDMPILSNFKWAMAKYDDPVGEDSYILHAIPVPICIKDLKPLIETHKRWMGRYETSAQLQLVLPKVSVQVGVNRYLVVDYRLDGAREQIPAVLAYNPDELADKNAGKLHLAETRMSGSNHEFFSGVVGVCPKPAIPAVATATTATAAAAAPTAPAQ